MEKEAKLQRIFSDFFIDDFIVDELVLLGRVVDHCQPNDLEDSESPMKMSALVYFIFHFLLFLYLSILS